jgi:hypothetical protein
MMWLKPKSIAGNPSVKTEGNELEKTAFNAFYQQIALRLLRASQ